MDPSMEAVAATAKGDNGKSAESTTDPKKKKKRRKKKQVKMVSIVPGNEAEISLPSTELSKSEEHDIQVREIASKKEKRKIKKKDTVVSEVKLNPGYINSDNEDMFKTPEKVKSKSSFLEEGIRDPVESGEQEAVEGGQPSTEGDDVLNEDIRRDSGKGYSDLNEGTIPSGKDEKFPLLPDEEGGSSTPEAVTDGEIAESATTTATTDGAVLDSSSIHLPIGDDVESDTSDDSYDVPVDIEGWVHMHLITVKFCFQLNHKLTIGQKLQLRKLPLHIF